MSLYGQVQQEVLEATLRDDLGVDSIFRDTTPIYVERPEAAARRSRSCTGMQIP